MLSSSGEGVIAQRGGPLQKSICVALDLGAFIAISVTHPTEILALVLKVQHFIHSNHKLLLNISETFHFSQR